MRCTALPCPRPTRAALVERSGGNPFFLEELLAAVQSGETGLTPELRSLLLARLHGLDEKAAQLVAIGAVLGMSFDHEVVVEVSGREDDEVIAGVRALMTRGVIRENRDEDRYVFSHALQREAVLDDLLRAETRSIHRRVAELVALRSGDDPGAAAELAHHWEAAGESANAHTARLRAARYAVDVWALETAVAQYEHLIGQAEGSPSHLDHAAVIELLLEAGQVAIMSSTRGDIGRDWLRRIAESGNGSTREAHAFAQGLLGMSLWRQGEGAAGWPLLDAATEWFTDSDRSERRARVFAARAQAANAEGRPEEAEMFGGRALEDAIVLGLPDVEANALVTLAGRAGDLGLVDESTDLFRHAERVIDEHELVDERFRAYINEAVSLRDNGCFEESFTRTFDALERWSSAMSSFERDSFRATAAIDLTDTGDVERARLLLSDETFDPDGLFAIEHYAASALVDAASGDLDSAARHSDQLVAECGKYPHANSKLLAAMISLPIAARRDDIASVVEHVGTVVENPVTSGFGSYCYSRAWVEALRALRLLTLARTRSVDTRAWRSHADELAATDRHPPIAGYRNAGLLEYESLDGAVAPPRWLAASEAFSRELIQALACRDAAVQDALRAGDRAVARDLARAGYESAETAGVFWYVGRFVELGRRAGVRGGMRTLVEDSPISKLSKRERDVFFLLAEGRTSREIAAQLFISVRTAEDHSGKVMRKLGLARRAEVPVFAAHHGLLRDQ